LPPEVIHKGLPKTKQDRIGLSLNNDKTRQDKTRQDKTRQPLHNHKTIQDKTRQDKTRQDNGL
jgi:hypothetical protein